jgi:hypothetical protein
MAMRLLYGERSAARDKIDYAEYRNEQQTAASRIVLALTCALWDERQGAAFSSSGLSRVVAVIVRKSRRVQ